MGSAFDCASSSLLCPEDNDSILDFDEEEDANGGAGRRPGGSPHGHGLPQVHSRRNGNGGFYGDFFMGFPLLSDECFAQLLSRESEHLPREGYAQRLQTGALDLSIRTDAVHWIGKAHAHFGFGPLTAYLSVNYLDRFLSAYELPQGKAWMTQLLSVACLSLAAKMEETEVPLTLDLQVGESKFVFEAQTIQRMELLLLGTLRWRMRAVTPFSYIDYFLHKFGGHGRSPDKPLLSQSMELILATSRRIEFLEFRPSEVAAAVTLLPELGGKAQTLEEEDITKALSCCIHVDQERALRCYQLIRDMASTRGSRDLGSFSSSISSVPRSPIGVLDAVCLSYKSDETTVGSQANSDHTSPDAKRRKLNTISTS